MTTAVPSPYHATRADESGWCLVVVMSPHSRAHFLGTVGTGDTHIEVDVR